MQTLATHAIPGATCATMQRNLVRSHAARPTRAHIGRPVAPLRAMVSSNRAVGRGRMRSIVRAVADGTASGTSARGTLEEGEKLFEVLLFLLTLPAIDFAAILLASSLLAGRPQD